MGDDELRKHRGLGALLSSLGSKSSDGSTKTEPSKGISGEGNASFSKEGGGSKPSFQQSNNKEEEQGSGVGAQANKRKREEDFGSGKLSSWASMKEYDDDHDSDWFAAENARLAKLYGGTFIYAKYLDSQPGKVGYYCELCLAEMNARKSLELHCSGMKHLKKKDMWEKMDGPNGGQNDSGPSHPPLRGPRPGPGPRPPPRPGWDNRGPPQPDFGGPRPLMDLPNQGPPPPDYRNDRGYYDRRDDYDRYPDNYYDDYHRKEPMPFRAPPYGDEPPYGRRDTPGGRDHDYPPGPDRRGMRDRYSRERYDPYERREAPPPPVLSRPEGPAADRMPPYGALFEGISDGSCSELLKRLAVCRVKNMEDCILATNVTNFLVISLKDYYSNTGQPTIARILDEIQDKIEIMKDMVKV